jgi:hypothetical protein
MKYVLFLIVSVALLLGLALRSVEVFNRNYVFVYDQGLDMMAARSIATDHKLTLIGAEAGGGFAGLPGIFHGPGYHYILAAISAVSSGDPYGEMVVLWLMNIAGIWLLYLIGKKLFGFWGGAGSAAIALVSPALIGMTRTIWAPNFAGLFVICYLYMLLVRKHKSPLDALLLGLSGSLLYHFEIPLAVAASLGGLIYLLFANKFRKIVSLAAFMAGCVIGVFPMLAFDARHGWLTMRGLSGFFLHPAVVTKSAPFDIMGHVTVMLYHANGIFPTIPGLPYWFWFAVLGIGVWLFRPAAHHAERPVNALKGLLILVGVHLLLFLPYRNPIYGHYLTILSYTYVLIAGFIVMRVVEEKQWLLLGIIVLFVAVPPILTYPKTIRTDYYDYGGTAKIRGKIDAVDFIYRDAKGSPFGLLVFTPPVYTYPYDYVLQWYAKPRYGYLPTPGKDHIFYLLIEQDPDKPWSYQGWLETVIKSGTTVASWTLPSGFIIEKRVE